MEARELVRRDHLAMLNAIAKPFRRGRRYVIFFRIALRLREGVERHLRAAVADRMEAELKMTAVALARHRIQLLLIVLRQACVLRVVRVRRKQGGGARSER